MSRVNLCVGASDFYLERVHCCSQPLDGFFCISFQGDPLPIPSLNNALTDKVGTGSNMSGEHD